MAITLSHNFQREGGTGTPVGDSPRCAEIEIGQEIAFVLGNGGSSSRHVDVDDDDFAPMGKGGMPAGSLESVKTEMGQKTSLVEPKVTLVDNGGLENEQVKRPGSRYEVRTITITYKRKRRWPANSAIAQKLVLVDSSSSSSDGKSNGDDHCEPPTKRGRPPVLKPTKGKRGRPPGSKSAKDKEDGIGSLKPGTGFHVVKSFRSFKVIVGGSAIDDKLLPIETRRAYHGLCRGRKSLLHGRMQKPICPLLTVGVIIETVRIAEGIRATAASPSREDLMRWKKALESFEMMGMDVGFMRERVDSLLTLLEKADHLHEGYKEAKLERSRATKGLRVLELKLSSIKDALKEIDMELHEMASDKTNGFRLIW